MSPAKTIDDPSSSEDSKSVPKTNPAAQPLGEVVGDDLLVNTPTEEQTKTNPPADEEPRTNPAPGPQLK